MNIEIDDNQKLVYHMLEVRYIKAMGREVSWKPEVNHDLYPSGWFSNSNYVKKAEILAEAIEKKCLISETSKYLDIIEGVREKNQDEEEER